jgi:hypothetical protein
MQEGLAMRFRILSVAVMLVGLVAIGHGVWVFYPPQSPQNEETGDAERKTVSVHLLRIRNK